MKKMLKRAGAMLLALAVAVTMVPVASPYGQVSAEMVSNPRVTEESAIWDCVYFGSYPQGSDGNGGFKTEPIKWRVLHVDGDDAFLIADKNLDVKPYNDEYEDTTWENCTLRQWLNNDFLINAFSETERSVIIQTSISNKNSSEDGMDDGQDTLDNIFALSLEDIAATSYGYNADKARVAANTAYVASKGMMSNEGINDPWWLRSMRSSTYASYVSNGGLVDSRGVNVNACYELAVRPALHLNLKSSVWSYAGTVSSDGTTDVVDPVEPAEEENPEVVNPNPQQATAVELTSSDVSLSYASITYTGGECKPTVTVKSGSKVLKEGANYKVAYGNNVNAGIATVKVTGIGSYMGTVKKNFTIRPMKITSMSISAKSYVYNGRVKKPAVTVKAGKATLASKAAKDNSKVTITYASGRKNVGKYKVTVKGKGNYTGTLSKSFTINPKGTTILEPKKLKKGFTAKWKKQSSKMGKTRITGYEARYSLKKNFKSGVKKKTVKGYKKTSLKVIKLKAKKTYYVQVRTYKTMNGTKYYSKWSKTKSVKTK